MIIAVDGPTASGKGTISKALAKHYGLPHLDTGLLYRAVGYQVALTNGNPDDPADALKACDFPDSLLGNHTLRSEGIGGLASRVSIHPEVRQALFDRQRAFATQAGGAVMDGRDIGTVIVPEADAKLYITASLEARSERRFKEMQMRGDEPDLADITDKLIRRDARDMGRKDAPLEVAQDASVIDTSFLGKTEAVARAIAIIDGIMG